MFAFLFPGQASIYQQVAPIHINIPYANQTGAPAIPETFTYRCERSHSSYEMSGYDLE